MLYTIALAVLLAFGAQDAARQPAPPRQPAASQQQPSAPVNILTLQEAVRAALAQGDRAQSARDRTEQAKLAVRLAHSPFNLQVTPNLFGSFGQTTLSNQTYGLNVSQRFTTGTQLQATVGTGTAQNQLGTYFSTDVTFQVTQPLLRGSGRDVVRRQLLAAQSATIEAERQQVLTERQVAIEVATAYYGVVTDAQMSKIADKSLERAQQLLAASEAKLAAGKVSRLDVLRARQLASEADLQAVDARAGMEEAKDQLRLLISRDADFDFTVVEEIAVADEASDEAQAVASALAHRPEIASADLAVTEAQRNANVARNGLLPQLDLNLALSRRETADSFGRSFGLNGFRVGTFAGVSYPFDRTPQSVAYETAIIDLNQKQRDRRMLRARVGQEVRQAVRSYERLRKMVALADSTVAVAEQEGELALLRFQRGLSNNLDVVTAEASVLAAHSRYATLSADLALARLRMHAAIGDLDPRTDVR